MRFLFQQTFLYATTSMLHFYVDHSNFFIQIKIKYKEIREFLIIDLKVHRHNFHFLY